MGDTSYGVAHGRFQPFHIEHLGYLLKILSLCDHLIVAITNPTKQTIEYVEASDHRHLDSANPFSYFERARMVELALSEAGIDGQKYTVVPFDLFNPTSWPDFLPVETSTIFVRIFSAWEEEKLQLFRSNGLKAEILDRPQRKAITATEVRKRMKEGHSVVDLLPPAVSRFLEARKGQ